MRQLAVFLELGNLEAKVTYEDKVKQEGTLTSWRSRVTASISLYVLVIWLTRLPHNTETKKTYWLEYAINDNIPSFVKPSQT